MPDFAQTQSHRHARLCGVILTLSLGTRHSFGLFLQPMSMDNGWGREVFGFCRSGCRTCCGEFRSRFRDARQDRFARGACSSRGGLLYALGLAFMANSTTALGLDPRDRASFVGIGMSLHQLQYRIWRTGRGLFGREEERGASASPARQLLRSLRCLRSHSSFITGFGWLFRADRVVAARRRDDCRPPSA